MGVPYSQVALKAILPAVLYFTGIYIAVHLEAQKLGLKGIPRDELPKFGPLMKKIYLLAPLVVLVVLVSTNTFTMQFSASVAIFIAIAVGLINKDNRITWKKILDALEAGGKGTITVAVACAMAGIVAGCITSTGLASKPVSYTHLDVYKRQIHTRSPLRSARRSSRSLRRASTTIYMKKWARTP